MSEDEQKPPLDAALRHLAEQQRRSLTSHPTPQELAAYHAGELPPEAEAKILDHLAICRECSDLLLDLVGFADLKPPQGVPELTDEQVEQDWQKLRSRMKEGEVKKERTAEIVPIRPAGPAAKPERTYPMWIPIAASLLTVLGFSFGLYQNSQVAKLEQRLSEERLPWSPPAVTLDDATVRSGGGQQDVKRITSEDGAILSLYSDVEETYPAYEAEIVGRATFKATPPREEGAPVSLVIPRGYLKPDAYEIQLYGVKGDQREPLGRYNIQVDEP